MAKVLVNELFQSKRLPLFETEEDDVAEMSCRISAKARFGQVAPFGCTDGNWQRAYEY